MTPLPSQDLRSSSTQNPSTTTASQYAAPFRSALPVGPGEAPSLVAAAKDTIEHLLQDEEEGGQSTYSRPPPDSKAPQPSASDHPNIRVSVNEPPEIESYERLLKKECTNLLNEIDRLEMTRAMLNNRLGNVMELVSCTRVCLTEF